MPTKPERSPDTGGAVPRRGRAPRRALATALKLASIGTGVIVLAVGSCFVMTDPHPETLPARAGKVVSRSWSKLSPRPPAGGPARAEFVPLFSDGWLDDSGYGAAMFFSKPIVDPSSLAEIRSSSEFRGRDGVARLEANIARLPAGDPRTPFDTSNLKLLIGLLLLHDGRFAEADARFQQAQAADPSRPAAFRANVDVLRGIASLRRGEIENCVACKNASSCIFPLAPGAVHGRRSGSREAIAHFERYLKERPEDVGVRWLLNVAHMTLGQYPRGVPREFLLPLGRFAAQPSAAGPVPRLTNEALRVGLNARGEAMAGGCLVDDFDGDGLLDVFTSTADPARGAALWRNRGDGTFEDRSRAAGLSDQVMALNARHADFDNDGAPDVLLLRGGWEVPRRMSLLRNRGDGTFEDVTLKAGLGRPIATMAAGWADFDNDGWLDLYVGGEQKPDQATPLNRSRLYRNRRDGTFEDVAEAAGVTNDRFAKGVAWGDYDDDGLPDLYVSNRGWPNRLYHNDGGTFTDVAPRLGLTGPDLSFACWFWDYDNDGRLDLWVNGYNATLAEVVRDQLGRPAGGERPRLYRNIGKAEGFRDVTAEVGLDRVMLPMGCNFGDIDNDGFLDIYLGTGRPDYSSLVPNLMFRNVGGRRFDDVTAATGTGHLQKGHGVAFADWDRDGDTDLFLEAGGATPGDRAHNVLFQNPGNGNHWLTIRLVGTRTNRAALGAKIRLDLPGDGGAVVSRYRTITSGSSFGGNPFACTVGLGAARSIRELHVTWPASGQRQSFRDVPVDRSIEVIEGRADFRVLDAPPISLPSEPNPGTP